MGIEAWVATSGLGSSPRTSSGGDGDVKTPRDVPIGTRRGDPVTNLSTQSVSGGVAEDEERTMLFGW
jgi:hypothetical protein